MLLEAFHPQPPPVFLVADAANDASVSKMIPCTTRRFVKLLPLRVFLAQIFSKVLLPFTFTKRSQTSDFSPIIICKLVTLCQRGVVQRVEAGLCEWARRFLASHDWGTLTSRWQQKESSRTLKRAFYWKRKEFWSNFFPHNIRINVYKYISIFLKLHACSK